MKTDALGGTPRSAPSLVEPRSFACWAHLKEHLRNQHHTIFRGQRSIAWALETSLERTVSGEQRANAEATLYGEFHKAAHRYIDPRSWPPTLVDWFATMQHHGTPTRLLDFTESPYVAAYFAIEDCSAGDAALWSIDSLWLHDRANTIAAAATPESKEPQSTAVWRYFYTTEWWKPLQLVAPAGPLVRTERHIAQQATFVISGDVTRSFEDNLRSTATSDEALREHVKCFSIPGRWRAEMLRDLRLMNITRASLFPGLDGVAQSLKYALISEDPEQEALRRLLAGPIIRVG